MAKGCFAGVTEEDGERGHNSDYPGGLTHMGPVEGDRRAKEAEIQQKGTHKTEDGRQLGGLPRVTTVLNL